MNIPPQPLELGHAHTSPTHPTTIFASMLVRYDATNTSTPSKRSYVYAADGAHDHNGIAEPHRGQFSPDIDIPSDDFDQIHQAKHDKQPPTPISGFQKDHHRKPTPSAPKKPFKRYDGPVYVPAEVYNSSVLRLLLSSRNIVLRPSTSLPRKGDSCH